MSCIIFGKLKQTKLKTIVGPVILGSTEGQIPAADHWPRVWSNLTSTARAHPPGYGLWSTGHWKWCIQV